MPVPPPTRPLGAPLAPPMSRLGAGVPPPAQNDTAVIALVLALTGFGPVAVWYGRRAQREIDSTGAPGRRLADVAVAVGWVTVVGWLFLFAVILLGAVLAGA